MKLEYFDHPGSGVWSGFAPGEGGRISRRMEPTLRLFEPRSGEFRKVERKPPMEMRADGV
jgi:hypothetical protein